MGGDFWRPPCLHYCSNLLHVQEQFWSTCFAFAVMLIPSRPWLFSCWCTNLSDAQPLLLLFHQIVTGDDLVVFMKGNPQQPQCGFSRTVCILLEMHGVDMSNLYVQIYMCIYILSVLELVTSCGHCCALWQASALSYAVGNHSPSCSNPAFSRYASHVLPALHIH